MNSADSDHRLVQPTVWTGDDVTDRAWILLRQFYKTWLPPLIKRVVEEVPVERRQEVEHELVELCDPAHAFDGGQPRLRLFAQRL